MKPENKKKLQRAVDAGTNAAAWTIGAVIRLALKILLSVLLVLVCTGLLFSCIFAVYVKKSLYTGLDISLSD